MAEACYTVDVRCGLNVEDHAGLQNLIRERMNPRLGVVINRRIADPVSGCVTECITKAVFRHRAACGRVHGACCCAGMYGSNGAAASFGDGGSDLPESSIR